MDLGTKAGVTASILSCQTNDARFYCTASAAAKAWGVGVSSKLGTSASILIQACLRLVQIWAAGATSLLRSSVPTRSTSISGTALFRFAMRVKHDAQPIWSEGMDSTPTGKRKWLALP